MTIVQLQMGFSYRFIVHVQISEKKICKQIVLPPKYIFPEFKAISPYSEYLMLQTHGMSSK